MPIDDIDHLARLRGALLDHPLYADVVSLNDLRRFMEDHVFAVWDFMSLLKRLQQDITCTRVPWLPADNPKAGRLINDIVIGEETDVVPDSLYVSHLELYLRAMKDVGASTVQFDTFCSMVRAGDPVEVVLTRIGVARHVRAFVTHTMDLANTGTTEEVLAAFFYGREDIIPEMFHRLLKTLNAAQHDEPLGFADGQSAESVEASHNLVGLGLLRHRANAVGPITCRAHFTCSFTERNDTSPGLAAILHPLFL